jgi:mono/diheme cytochrome c family protein
MNQKHEQGEILRMPQVLTESRIRLLAAAALACAAGTATAQEGAATAAQFDELVQGYCLTCHNLEDWAGGVAMDTLDLAHVEQEPEIWETAIDKLRGRLMPPAGADQPSQTALNSMVAYLEKSIDSNDPGRNRGHVPIQRLNRREFASTVEGLIGVRLDPRQILPTDIEVEGFDNIAEALDISPSFLEQYISTARRAARLAVGEPVPKLSSVFYPSDGGSQRGGGDNQTTHRDGYPLGTRGGMGFTHVFPVDGEYRFSIMDIDAGLYPRGLETEATLVLLVDSEEADRVTVGGHEDLALVDRDGPDGQAKVMAKVSNLKAVVTAGAHDIKAAWIERSRAQSNSLTGNSRVSAMPRAQGGIQVDGPFDPLGLSMNDSRSMIFVCQPAEQVDEQPCAQSIARHLGTLAFRRPVTEEDLDWLMPFYEAGRAEAGGFDAGVIELVTAILSSPDFLYRVIESSPAEDSVRELDDLELASRMSFLIWSRGPDEELIALAADGKLSDPAVIDAQVDRMLDDPRAFALVENFALAWLNLDELEQVEPIDPSFNDGMRDNLETEIRLFLASVLLEDRSVVDLLSADYTFVNDALARHYDIPDVLGPQFRRVTLADENRWGLLGKGAMLLRTSYGDRTSPVLRGAWVLDRIMGTPPPPPPPNVETDLSVKPGEVPTTVRERLETHRANPSCNACHGLIDPPGLALENFDVTGKWREIDEAAKARIDASTVLTSGLELEGPADLRRYLVSKPDQFPTTVTRRLMMYALNREIEYYDMPQVRDIVRNAARDDYRFAAIIKGVIKSDAFRTQGPEQQLTSVAASD